MKRALMRSALTGLLPILIVLVGIVQWALVSLYPAAMPIWMPYEFSWGVYLTAAFGLYWYVRGLVRTPPSVRPRRPRIMAFVLGVLLIYASMHTWLEFAAQHMFFIHRLQHLVLHHSGPFLIALSNPLETLRRGCPERVRDALDSGPMRTLMRVLQQPFIASFLFVALIYIWPLPPVHFRAMIDPRLYTVMNWSVTIDGILFWALILDPRPKEQAGIYVPAAAGQGAP